MAKLDGERALGASCAKRERELTKVEGLGSIDEEDCIDSQQNSNCNAEAVELANCKGAQGKEEGHNLKNRPASHETRIKLFHGTGWANSMLYLCRSVITSRSVGTARRCFARLAWLAREIVQHSGRRLL